MSVLFTVLCALAALLLFSFAIFIHEFGHYLAARLLGMKVDAFSIGFGPAIWKRRIGGIEYRVSWILFGGYVALPQLDPAGMERLQGGHGDGEAVPSAPPWKRIAVAVAGPFGNVVLAVALAVGLALAPSARFGELGTEIGDVLASGPAAGSGVEPGDSVVAVNGHPVRTWYEMQTEVQIAGERPAAFRLRAADGSEREVSITPRRDPATDVVFVGLVSVTNLTRAASWMPARNPVEQLKWDAMSIARVLKALVTPRESGAVAKSIGGPVLIATSLYRQVRQSPWDALGFLRFLCINLALLNLLPLPVVDGGHCMFALYEIVARRRPGRRVVTWATNAFGYLLIALFVWLLYHDSERLWKASRASAADAPAAVEEEPPETPSK